MKKMCNKCKTEKSIEDFGFKSKKRNKRHGVCKGCMRDMCNDLYKRSSSRRLDIRKVSKELWKNNVEFLNRYKQFVGCKVCHEKKHYMLDMHHREGEVKDGAVSILAKRGSRKKLKKEIRKCTVLCANHHREEHYLEKVR